MIGIGALRRTGGVLFRLKIEKPNWFLKETSMECYVEKVRRKRHELEGKWGKHYISHQPLWPSAWDMEFENTNKLVREKRVLHLSDPKRPTVALADKQPNTQIANTNHDSSVSTRSEPSAHLSFVPYPRIRTDSIITSQVPLKSELSHEQWGELGFDPVLCDRLVSCIGSKPSKAQARILPVLLNEQCDILIAAGEGSGLTSALLASIVHGVRCEDEGLNFVLCSSVESCEKFYNRLIHFAKPYGGAIVSRHIDSKSNSWAKLAQYREDAEQYAEALLRSRHDPVGPIRLVITTPEVWNDLETRKPGLKFNSLGLLRRVYVDDIDRQLCLPPEYLSIREIKERDANPSAIELTLASIHQRLSAPTRSACQIVCVGSNVCTKAKKHLKELCLNPFNTRYMLCMERIPSTIRFSHVFHRRKSRYSTIIDLAQQIKIPGRMLICVADNDDVMEARFKLRSEGMAAMLLDDVILPNSYGSISEEMVLERHFQGKLRISLDWRFLILTETQLTSFGGFPLVSHIVVACIPHNRYQYLHFLRPILGCGKSAWCINMWSTKSTPQVAEILGELDIDITQNAVDGDELRCISPQEMALRVAPPERWDLDPQRSVIDMYCSEEDPVARANSQLFRRDDTSTSYIREDYTPLSQQKREYKRARKLFSSVGTNSELLHRMIEGEFIRPDDAKPTRKLWSWLKAGQSTKERRAQEYDAEKRTGLF